MINILITGGCGSGKTWVMKQLIKALSPMEPAQIGLYHFVQNGEVAVLGKYDGTMFEGSDRLAMNIMADNTKMAGVFENFKVVAEGDRFTNNTYIQAFKPIIVRIKDDGSAGRKLRGSEQTERHTKSIATRVNNILPTYEAVNSNQCLIFVLCLLNGKPLGIQPYKSNELTLF